MTFSSYYIILYIILLLAVFLSNILKNKIVLYSLVVIVVLFSGFRYGAGIDYFSYENMIYGNYPLFYVEPLSRFFLLLSRSYEQPFIFFLSTSIIYILSVFLGAYRLRSFGMFFIFLFTTYTTSYLTSFGFVRQYVAIGLVFLGFSYLYENRRKYFLFFIILATLFHLSGIIFIVFILFNKLFKKAYKFYAFIVAIVLSFFSTSLFRVLINKIGLFANYFEKDITSGEVSGKKIFYSIILVFFFVSLIQHFFLKNKTNKILIYAQNMSFIGLFIYGVFFQFGEHIARISYFFTPFYFVWFYQLYKELKGKELKSVFVFFMFFVCTFYYFSTLYFAQFSERGDILNNYQLFFLR